MSKGKVEKKGKERKEKNGAKKQKAEAAVAEVEMEGQVDAEVAAKQEEITQFEDLNLDPKLLEACKEMKYTTPTPIQAQAIPYALEGRDVMGLAATGSGKTAAFALPVLNSLYKDPSPYYCAVLSPTRELATQIAGQFKALGGNMGVNVAVIIGGEDLMKQSLELSKKPHVIVATPGRLLEHLEKTKGFSLRTLKYLVLDEADRLLDMDFKEPITRILGLIPRERHTYLFSATPSKEVEQLKRASLSNPVLVKVNEQITTVDTLIERMTIASPQDKDAKLVTILNSEGAGKSVIVFTNTKDESMRIAMVLSILEFSAISINGNMTQNERQAALNKFKAGQKRIMVATNVCARGLDIPQVDIVINAEVPENADDYIHRCGRTARAGRSGKAITFVSQYNVGVFLNIESTVHKDSKILPLEIDEEEVKIIRGSIDHAQRMAKRRLNDIAEKKRGKQGFHKGKRPNRDDRDRDN